MKILSLFDGISCARVALERASIKVDKYYASEIDKYAIQIAQKNYPDTIQIGNITELKGNDFEDIDLIIGGSPCQDLSIAKKDRKGLSGERSGLFYEYVRILNEVKPKYFILENVASMPKEAKRIITETLYDIEPIIINAALVSAQNRKRLFWVGKLDESGTYKKVDVSLPEDRGILLKDILEENVGEKYYVKLSERWDTSRLEESVNLSANGGGRGAKTGLYLVGLIDGKNSQGKRVYSPNGKSTTLGAGTTAGGESGRRTGLYLINSKGKTHQQDLLQTTEGKCRTIPAGTHASTPHLLKTIMPTGQIRKLTPIECERLQGLPDNYTDGVSNTQRYKALGNAFNVDVVAHILSFFTPSKEK